MLKYSVIVAFFRIFLFTHIFPTLIISNEAVGIQGIGDVKQLTLHTLDFNTNMKFNAHWSVKFSAKNLLNTDVVFRQEIPSKNTEVEVERFNEGVGLSFGVTYTL